MGILYRNRKCSSNSHRKKNRRTQLRRCTIACKQNGAFYALLCCRSCASDDPPLFYAAVFFQCPAAYNQNGSTNAVSGHIFLSVLRIQYVHDCRRMPVRRRHRFCIFHRRWFYVAYCAAARIYRSSCIPLAVLGTVPVRPYGRHTKSHCRFHTAEIRKVAS